MDWKTVYLGTWNHPHRQMIVDALKPLRFESLLELGCASGPNLFRIQKEFPNISLSGIDINPDAIRTARDSLGGGADLRVGGLAPLGFECKSQDVVLTDMVLIYVSGIEAVLSEIRRVARKHLLLCEFHCGSALGRLGLKLASGYRAYDYPRVLARAGFSNVTLSKIPAERWPHGTPQKWFGYIITADVGTADAPQRFG